MPNFIPYHQIHGLSPIVVDGIHPKGFMLSHWKGAPVPEGCADDTSAGIVLNALKQAHPSLHQPDITATHFDIDGFIGVWSLFNPIMALEYEALLKEVAMIGDFREIDFSFPDWEKALQLVCWINAEEKAKFYVPFGSEHEMETCAQKFDYFLPVFASVLANPELYRKTWETEFQLVKEHLEIIQSSQTVVHTFPKTGLTSIYTPEPLHYYALFSASKGMDAVLTMYDTQRYELELKYTTWVNISSRPSFPRIPLEPLAAILNRSEKSGFTWFAEKLTDTGPLLRLENQSLSKADRFADPYQRVIYTSSIAPETFESIVKDYFQHSMENIRPKFGWSWEEMRKIHP